MGFGLTSSSSSSGESFIDKHFRHASRSRLIAYAVVCLAVLVAIILWITLSGGEDETKFYGRDVLKETPLVDGFGGFPWQIHSRFKDNIDSLDLEKVIKDSSNITLETDLSQLVSGFVGAQIWEITDSCDSKEASVSAIIQQDLIKRIIQKSSHLKAGLSSADISNAFDEKRTAILSSLNGGHLMGDKLPVLRMLYDLGLRIFTLNKQECVTKKLSNFVAVPDPNDNTKFVLTKFVETVISELNRLGIIIDLTGSDVNTQMLVLKKSKAPVVFSHSVSSLSSDAAFAVKDEVMQLLRSNKGLLMLNFGAEQIATTATKPPDSTTLIQHFNYIRDKFGVDYIGIGAGFDSSEQFKPVLKSPAEYPTLFDDLAAKKIDNGELWNESDLKQLAGQNFDRVFKEVEKVRDDLVNDKPYNYEEQPKKEEEEKKEDDKNPK